MRKLSLLSILLVAGLVVGLAGNVALADWGEDASSTAELETNGVMKMRVESGESVTLGSFNPQNDQNFDQEDDKTTIKVVSNKGWEVTSDDSVTEGPDGDDEYTGSTITDHFLVKKDGSDDGNAANGEKGSHTFDVEYGWDALSNSEMGDMPDGEYTIEITYTISPD